LLKIQEVKELKEEVQKFSIELGFDVS